MGLLHPVIPCIYRVSKNYISIKLTCYIQRDLQYAAVESALVLIVYPKLKKPTIWVEPYISAKSDLQCRKKDLQYWKRDLQHRERDLQRRERELQHRKRDLQHGIRDLQNIFNTDCKSPNNISRVLHHCKKWPTMEKKELQQSKKRPAK